MPGLALAAISRSLTSCAVPGPVWSTLAPGPPLHGGFRPPAHPHPT